MTDLDLFPEPVEGCYVITRDEAIPLLCKERLGEVCFIFCHPELVSGSKLTSCDYADVVLIYISH